jgi:hypothetical protein
VPPHSARQAVLADPRFGEAQRRLRHDLVRATVIDARGALVVAAGSTDVELDLESGVRAHRGAGLFGVLAAGWRRRPCVG